MRISDWSSDVCSSDLLGGGPDLAPIARDAHRRARRLRRAMGQHRHVIAGGYDILAAEQFFHIAGVRRVCRGRSEEHTSELQSLMRISYAVFCLKKKNKTKDY